MRVQHTSTGLASPTPSLSGEGSFDIKSSARPFKEREGDKMGGVCLFDGDLGEWILREVNFGAFGFLFTILGIRHFETANDERQVAL